MIEQVVSLWPVPAVLLAIATIMALARRALQPPPASCEKKGPLLNRDQREFYRILQNAVADHLRIFAKVHLADLVSVRADGKDHESLQNRVDAAHVDFVLCDPESLEPRLAIQMHDARQQEDDEHPPAEDDPFLGDTLSGVGLPLLTIEKNHLHGAKSLRRSIWRQIG